MRAVTAEEIRNLDRIAITELGMPGPVLMENAGAAVVDVIVELAGPVRGKRALILCGSGNNGGDGYVIARRLLLLGAAPIVLLHCPEEAIKGDALVHYIALKRSQGADIRSIDALDLNQLLLNTDVVVDALLGTGLKSAPREPYASTIRALNKARNGKNRQPIIVSVDIPSGIDSDTGAAPRDAVKAHATVTFGYPKVGLYCFPGAECAGKVFVDDIGFQWDQIAPPPDFPVCTVIDRDIIGHLFASRPRDANKGDFGHVGIIAGSRGMVGAPALTARAAQRTGVGLVTVLTAASAQPAIAAKLDEQMTSPLPEADGSISQEAFDA